MALTYGQYGYQPTEPTYPGDPMEAGGGLSPAQQAEYQRQSQLYGTQRVYNTLDPNSFNNFSNIWAGGSATGAGGHGIDRPNDIDFSYLNQNYLRPELFGGLNESFQNPYVNFAARGDLANQLGNSGAMYMTSPEQLAAYFQTIPGAMDDPQVQSYLQAMGAKQQSAGEHQQAFIDANAQRALYGGLAASLIWGGGLGAMAAGGAGAAALGAGAEGAGAGGAGALGAGAQGALGTGGGLEGLSLADLSSGFAAAPSASGAPAYLSTAAGTGASAGGALTPAASGLISGYSPAQVAATTSLLDQALAAQAAGGAGGGGAGGASTPTTPTAGGNAGQGFQMSPNTSSQLGLPAQSGGITAPTAGAAPAVTPSAPSGLGSAVDGILETLKKNALQIGMSAIGLGLSAFADKGKEVPEAAGQLGAAGGAAAGAAQQMIAQAQSGQLSAGQAAGLDRYVNEAKQQVRQYYSSIHQFDSTSRIQAEALIDQQAVQLKQQILDQTLQAGIQALNGATPALQSAAQYQLGSDRNLTAALGQFALGLGQIFGQQGGSTQASP
jgi:hypothetical protein